MTTRSAAKRKEGITTQKKKYNISPLHGTIVKKRRVTKIQSSPKRKTQGSKAATQNQQRGLECNSNLRLYYEIFDHRSKMAKQGQSELRREDPEQRISELHNTAARLNEQVKYIRKRYNKAYEMKIEARTEP
ncbi:hypothetical protein DY000_02015435 [Brassica cretica]|uniref:Uncharacterized protein n=1 Tax=Brassica cretica TaxID=69181 RepID=A0ABQ7CNN5_BRACR|nr:hypothetical protein DY000_02015435 [Brassica cretica]